MIPAFPTLLVSEIQATPESLYDPAFDSKLSLSNNPSQNCKLRLTLRIYLKQIIPDNYYVDLIQKTIASAVGKPLNPNRKVGVHDDAGNTPKLIKDWQGTEWIDFVKKFIVQAQVWNKKFWLQPPDDFSLFDVKQGTSTFRPNVECELEVQILFIPGFSQQTIEVVNLYAPTDFFRSHSALYDSEDLNVKESWVEDLVKTKAKHTQSTVAHEIGHAIGLPHIGQTRSLPQCTVAIVFDKILPEGSVPTIFKGGSNGSTCYGNFATFGDADNVMGYGDKFAPENAQPWLDRIDQHIRFKIDTTKWKISMNEIVPMSLIGFGK